MFKCVCECFLLVHIPFFGSSSCCIWFFDAMNQCLCPGCSAVDCSATIQSICGTTLGKQKFRKVAGRCHWCQLPSSPDSSSSRPYSPFSFTASTQSTLYALDLFGPDGGEQFPLIATKNGSIPRTRHASGPCWEAHLGMMKNFVSDLHKRSAKHGWNLIYWSHEAMDATMEGVADDRLRCCYFAINPEYRAARTDLFRFWLMFSRGGVCCRNLADNLAVMDFIQGNVKTKDLVVNV